MIVYDSIYVEGSKPYLAKILVIDTNSVETRLGVNMPEEELELIPLTKIYSHLDNLVSYIQHCALGLTVPRLDEPGVEPNSAIKGYKDIDLAYVEASNWFMYIYKNREPEELNEETPA